MEESWGWEMPPAIRVRPNFLILEFRWKDRPWRDEILTEPLQVEDGHLIPPDGPGLGIDLNMDGVEKYLRYQW